MGKVQPICINKVVGCFKKIPPQAVANAPVTHQCEEKGSVNVRKQQCFTFHMARIIDSENTNIVGKNIRLHRRKRRMTQQALSNRLELLGVYVCRGSVSRIEYGVRTVTDIELLAISRVLEVSVGELFAGNENYFDC